MPNFSDITVVAVHGNNGIESILPALKKTAEALPNCKQLLITNNKIDVDIPQKLVQQIIRYEDYNPFIIYCLNEYIETDYCLIVGSDGWALNPNNWRNEWFNYDYIGAPGFTQDEKFAVIGYDYNPEKRIFINPNINQNGGFSLRSKQLLQAPTKYGITMKWDPTLSYNNEDYQLCCVMRPALESVGIKFAPIEEARLFSVEHLDKRIHEGLDLTKIFGQHSTTRRLLDNDVVQWHLTEEQTQSIIGETDLLNLLSYYKYNIYQLS
jgi:hypothetical protein